ncbi:hypothetical protein BC941DRAFT_445183 [Chlamydoabsidia padenii]|nr:hypothetical protein BC941DRAFT_445183 [Chlamydoabsidia padenii]
MVSAPISRDARLALQKLIENKMTWISIKHLLRQDANQLALIMEMGENANIEESMRLTYQSVYYQMNKTMKSKSQLDTDLAKSLVMWKEKIVQSGGYCFTKNMQTMNDGMFAFAFCSQWQMNCLRKDGRIVCLDSSHKTCVTSPRNFCYLCTLVVRSSETGKGQPVDFMVINHASSYSV